LEIKNKEYNFLIDHKDQEVSLYSHELVTVTTELENIKKDRLRDQKIINDLENEIEYLNSRIAELQTMFETDKNKIINGLFEQDKMVEKIEVIV
jgi:predicted  nucleic acid-binding Zn-ribbon protein